MLYAPSYMPKGSDPSVLRYVWPPRAQGGAGGYVSNDNLAVLKDAENPVLAHMFLNYMLDYEVAIKNYSWNAYQPPMNAFEPDKLVEDGTITREPRIDGYPAERLRHGTGARAVDARG